LAESNMSSTTAYDPQRPQGLLQSRLGDQYRYPWRTLPKKAPAVGVTAGGIRYPPMISMTIYASGSP
jgi:hypothetical protein